MAPCSAAGFAASGISEWLIDGVNGYLAPGSPPTPAGLAEAIVKCLQDRSLHAQTAPPCTDDRPAIQPVESCEPADGSVRDCRKFDFEIACRGSPFVFDSLIVFYPGQSRQAFDQ
jgi:hypothetical protein